VEVAGPQPLHKKRSAREEACRPWLNAELEVVQPHVILCLGATAAQALLGRRFRVTQDRGEVVRAEACERVIATYHLSAVLRAPNAEARGAMRRDLIPDVKKAVAALPNRGLLDEST